MRIVDAIHLEIDESSLTGETLPKRKGIHACAAPGMANHRIEYPNGSSPNGLTGLGLEFGNGVKPGEVVPLAERSCIAYMGTLVRNGMHPIFHVLKLSNSYILIKTKYIGKGTGIVVATGTQTEFGVIFSMMQDVCVSVFVYFPRF